MLKKSLAILIFVLGLTVGFSVRANDCPTDNGLGVGCNIGIGEYYCGGACRTGQPQCPTWTPSPICASIFTCNNFATADACGYGATCAGGYTRCGAWPNYNCTATIAPTSPCSTYDTCNNYCTACISGYALCAGTHVCVADPGCLPGQTFNPCTAACEGTVSMLKLGYDSVSGTSVIQSATYPTLFIPSSSNVGIGTSTPIAKLEVIPTSGYSILAGNFKIGNVALPTADSDAASKGYVDSVISSATSSLESFWGGTLVGNIWSLNSGNVGIGTTSPLYHLDIRNGLAGGNALYVEANNRADGLGAVMSFTGAGSRGVLGLKNANTVAGANTGLNLIAADTTSARKYSIMVDYADSSKLKINSDLTSTLSGLATGNLLTITSAGNVGIGTSSPLTRLHVSNGTPGLINPGTVPVTWIESSGTNYLGVYAPDALNSGIVFGSPTDGFGAAMYWNNNASLLTLSSQHTGASVAISSSNNSEAMRINSLGNVGVGTTSPVARLEVVPASGYSILAGNYKIGNVALPTADADAATKGYVDSTVASATSSITLWNGTTAGNIWSLNSGNVGIGTASPSAKLEVFGRISQQGLGNNMFIGYNAGLNDNLDLGNRNMAIGYYALQANVSGVYNTAIGYWALTANTSSGNLAVGYQALKANTTGGNNTALGRDSLLANIGGGQNTAIGYAALLANTSGNNNMAIGHTALAGNTTGGYNTAIGLSAGRYQADGITTLTDPENSVYIGSNTRGYDNSDSNSIVIGYNAIGVGANSVVLGNDSITKTILKGNVGIGTNNPGQKLEVNTGVASFKFSDYVLNYGNSLQITTSVNGYIWLRPGGSGDVTIDNDADTDFNVGAGRLFVQGSTGFVGIGTTTPLARLEVVPASGYSILAGSFKVGNVALPTADADAATKGYVDSILASSSSAFWSGLGDDIWNTNIGNVGIGTTTPRTTLHVHGSGLFSATPGAEQAPALTSGNWTLGAGWQYLTSPNRLDKNVDGVAATTQTGGAAIVANTNYTITVVVDSASGGSVRFQLGSVDFGTVSAPGTYTFKGTTANTIKLVLIPQVAGTRITISSISIIPNTAGTGDLTVNGKLILSNSIVNNNGVNLFTFGTFNGLANIGINKYPTANIALAISGGVTTDSSLSAVGITSTSIVTINRSGIGTTLTTGLDSTGTTAATVGAPVQQSPTMGFQGQAWNTTPTAISKINKMGVTMIPTSGLVTSGSLTFHNIMINGSANTTELMRITSDGNVGIGTTSPIARLEVVPASGYSILAGSYKIGNVAAPTADSDVVTLGWVNSALASVGGVATYSTSTPATYSGAQSGYSGANALCAATVAGTHVCTTGEIFNTINTGGGAAIPAGSTFWVSNGPPAYTANANDCMGWTSAAGGDYGTVWIKLATGDGFGSLNACNVARSFACCQ